MKKAGTDKLQKNFQQNIVEDSILRMDTDIEWETNSNLTSIQNFFFGQSVFITGVTGLVGKVILEKILRCCPGIGMVYIHMRPKKGLTPQQRGEKLLSLELFREVRKVFPDFKEHVRVVEGDITEDKLGLSQEDLEGIRENVSIVIHSAASVVFSDPIKSAVYNNVMPVLRILELCQKMPKIKAVVLMSTCYVKREKDGMVLQKLANIKIESEKVLDALEWMDEKNQNALEEFLIDNSFGQSNTYLVTKAMAEDLAGKRKGDLPVAVVRPCYISNTWKDPFPGWIDTIQGISGLFLAGAKGVVRTLYTIKGLKINLVPVDVVSNTALVSAWHVGTTKPVDAFIVNCAMDYHSLPAAEETLLGLVMEKRDLYPLVNMFRYPDFTYYYSMFAYYIHAFIDHWIPALIVDMLLFIFTGKTILFKVYSKINYLFWIFFELGKIPWIPQLDSYVALEKKLSEEDRKMFFMNMDNFDWADYLDICLQGGRKFLAREDPSNIPYAKKKAKVWWAVTTFLKWCILSYLFYYLVNLSIFNPMYKSLEEKVRSIQS